MLDSLLKTHARTLLIVQHPNIERERARLPLHLTKDLTGRRPLQLVLDRAVALEDRRALVLLACLAVLARHNENIHPPDLVLGKGNRLEVFLLLI